MPTYSFADLPQQGAASIETKNKITYNNKQLNAAINKAKSEKISNGHLYTEWILIESHISLKA